MYIYAININQSFDCNDYQHSRGTIWPVAPGPGFLGVNEMFIVFVVFTLVSCIGASSQVVSTILCNHPIGRNVGWLFKLAFPLLLGHTNASRLLQKALAQDLRMFCGSLKKFLKQHWWQKTKKQAGHAALILAKTCEETWAQAPVTISIVGTHTAAQHPHVKLQRALPVGNMKERATHCIP